MNSTYGERIDHDTYHLLEEMFVEGYRTAQDKLVYLRLSHIPFELPEDSDSEVIMHLNSVRIEERYDVGSVTPAFGSDKLVHHMYPHELVKCHKSLKFCYVQHGGVVEKSLRELFGFVIEDADHHD